MRKVECKDAGRTCEYGETFKTTSDIVKEYTEVEANRIGYDSIMKRVETGRYYRRVTELQVCKYCGKEKKLNENRKYV